MKAFILVILLTSCAGEMKIQPSHCEFKCDKCEGVDLRCTGTGDDLIIKPPVANAVDAIFEEN